MDSLKFCGAGRQKQHIPVSQKTLGAIGIDDGPRIRLRRNLEGEACGEIGLDDAGQGPSTEGRWVARIK